MPGEVNLKRCPFCGGDADIGIQNTNIGLRDQWRIGAYCEKCGAIIPKIEGVHDLWNLRTPEPGTSVIRWTRYDGTPETLPDLGRMILVHWINEMQIRTVNSGIHKLFDVGDLWAYLPESPEGME